MSENPHDPQHYDAHAGDAYDADPYATDHGHPGGPQGEAGQADEPGGPPYRAIAMVLLSAVVLAIGIGLVQLFGSGNDENPTAGEEGTSQVESNGQTGADGQNGAAGQDDADGQAPQPGLVGPDGQPLPPGADGQEPGAPADPNAPAPDGQADPAGGQGQPADGSAPNVNSVPVQIYNNSTVTGLAGRTGEQLREGGFAVGDVANMPSNRGVVAESTAFYGTGPGEQEAAQAIADTLGITAKPRPADMVGDAPGVIVIVTQDLER
ncbi:hypothetical protein NCCP2495_13200 [Dietzia sp. NCCP-2495]|uniref:LytR C-terminal domain-containing protein n=1 Tax=Dietzia sp. NCCP-2495 TaxID=2934675 RepID=UPI00222EB80C|nr:LytR C-terminal domain-containing protein [Dietzia sp. NCCP-2495]GLB63441.1 hypothetical protein NCCP2495_13200 [Dietzia sp. NCCP-2495]